MRLCAPCAVQFIEAVQQQPGMKRAPSGLSGHKEASSPSTRRSSAVTHTNPSKAKVCAQSSLCDSVRRWLHKGRTQMREDKGLHVNVRMCVDVRVPNACACKSHFVRRPVQRARKVGTSRCFNSHACMLASALCLWSSLLYQCTKTSPEGPSGCAYLMAYWPTRTALRTQRS